MTCIRCEAAFIASYFVLYRMQYLGLYPSVGPSSRRRTQTSIRTLERTWRECLTKAFALRLLGVQHTPYPPTRHSFRGVSALMEFDFDGFRAFASGVESVHIAESHVWTQQLAQEFKQVARSAHPRQSAAFDLRKVAPLNVEHACAGQGWPVLPGWVLRVFETPLGTLGTMFMWTSKSQSPRGLCQSARQTQRWNRASENGGACYAHSTSS